MHSPFDIMAETYDADFTNTAIGQLQTKTGLEILETGVEFVQRPVRISWK